MTLSITGLYLSLLGLLYIVLAVRIIKLRFRFQTGIGDGGHEPLAQAIRVHGNFAEYTPIVCLLLACAEINGSGQMLLHVIGGAFFIGRVLHSIGITHSIGPSKFRTLGMLSSFISIIVLAIENIRLFMFV
ncbi:MULTISPECIES: MAPEG family protein [Thalassotalea]|uniref:MAPEG family protein n=1 Tax=Thalassotalea castellviae TaxID=3075612 RepID=A0ABU2ZX24_9GAMM|nr:MAPEG family protein [Thalassotalea sp. W431]MDT0602464.1 MAPEG family protein [Thalassotalea sp. W431]